MKRNLIRVFCIASFIATPLNAEFRSWANTEGVKLEAEFVKADGDNVTLRLRSGKTTTFPQAKLSDADQEFIKTSSTDTPAEPKAAVDAKRKARWLTKLAKAQEESKETGLPILMLFTGTTWCSYCIKLENEVFSEKEFKTFANQNLVLLMLDFPSGGTKDKEMNRLKTEFGVTGYPTYFLTDASGAKLAKGGYNDGINPEKFADWVKKSVK